MVAQLFDAVRDIEARLNALQSRMDVMSVGGKIRLSQVIGVLPSSAGGVGIIGSPLGVTVWENSSGGTLSQGAVVVMAGDRLFTTTTTEGDLSVIGVVDGNANRDSSLVLNGQNARIRHIGYQAVVNAETGVLAGDYLIASTTAGQVASGGTEPVVGAFGIALTDEASNTLSAYLFPPIAGAGGGEGVLHISFLAEASLNTWTDQPAALTELLGLDTLRQAANLTNATRARLSVNVQTAGNTGAELRAQYSVDAGMNWAYLDGAGEPAVLIDATGFIVGAWVDLDAGAMADVWLRVIGIGGDGAADPIIGSLSLELEGSTIGGGAGIGDVEWATVQASQLVNEFRNHPSMEGADDAQPQWWSVSANATLTEVDLAGEGITEKYERALKVVTTASGAYGSQLFTYADEPRLKVGRTVSLICDVWSVSAAAARARVQSSVGSLGVSADVTAASWTQRLVEGVVLNGTTVEVRFEVDSGTAYFVPLGFLIGAKAIPLEPRGLRYVARASSTAVENLDGSTGKAVADLDLTSATSPLAVIAEFQSLLFDAGAGEVYVYNMRPNGSSWPITGVSPSRRAVIRGADQPSASTTWNCLMDASQIVESALERAAGAGSIANCSIFLTAWWEWE